jgi:hypothetical protein
MKGRGWIVVALAVLALSTLGCGCCGTWTGFRGVRISGPVVEEVREVSGFTGVELATSGNLTIEVGESEELRIEAPSDLMQDIVTDVRGDTLVIDIRPGVNVRLGTSQSPNYYLTVTELDEIIISSSGDIEAPDLEAKRFSVTISSSGRLDIGDLDADTLDVRVTSSGDMRMAKLLANRIEVDISSSGNVDISGGEVEEQDITITSSGEYRARDLDSAVAEVRLSSSGSATIRVQERLTANLSSSGDVRYAGNPTVEARTTSSGKVRRIGE